MEPDVNRRTPEDPRDLLGAYALGTVDAQEAVAVRALLAQDAAAEAELAELLAAVSVLPDLADPLEPPVGLRDRLAATALANLPAGAGPASPPAPHVVPGNVVRPRPALWQRASVWATAAAALLLVSLGLLFWNMQLRGELNAFPPAETMALAPTDMAPNASGQVKYMPREGLLMLEVRDLPPLPEGYVYEVWLIGEEGPVPAGVFDAASAQHAVVADRAQFTTLALTMEPGPMGTAAPTGDIYATAAL